MDKQPMSNSESNSYVGQPEPTPMPMYMTVEHTSSSTSTPSPIQEFMKIDAMDDYPGGRGGMQMVPIASAEQPAQSPIRPGVPIGTRPPETEMPPNP